MKSKPNDFKQAFTYVMSTQETRNIREAPVRKNIASYYLFTIYKLSAKLILTYKYIFYSLSFIYLDVVHYRTI